VLDNGEYAMFYCILNWIVENDFQSYSMILLPFASCVLQLAANGIRSFTTRRAVLGIFATASGRKNLGPIPE
jgi:hypothetical protein